MRRQFLAGVTAIDALAGDVRYGLRLIRKAPAFSAIAIASLTIGIGASTVLFSFANSFLFRPVHAANPGELVELFTSDFDGRLYGASSYADYEAFAALPVFRGLLASKRAAAALGRPGDDERRDVVSGLLVSGTYFDVLGLRPSQGRFFLAEENRTRDAHAVLVLSHDAWRLRFGADPTVVGRTVALNGRAFTVIGIGPPGFAGTSVEHAAEFFLPVAMHETIGTGADVLRDRKHRAFTILGRLQEDVAAAQASAALAVRAADLVREDPAAWRDAAGTARVVTVLPELEARFAGSDPGSVMFIFTGTLAAVGTLLLVACVNVATVLLARATTRRREIAVRLAMGASRWRLVRQLLTECGLLAAAGGALGLVLAQWAAALFARFRPEGVPPFDLTLDYRILLFSLAASAVTVVLFGLAPALQSTKPDVNAELKGAARSVRVRGLRLNLRAGLVVIQVALSLALMIGAALMLRSARAGSAQDPGFRRADVINVGINLAGVQDPRARARVFADAARAAAARPGVDRVALAALLPMDGSNSQVEIRIPTSGGSFSNSPDINIVGPGYFALLDIPVRHGREFTDADRGSSPVAVVNETMARQAWNGEAVGRTFIDEATGEQFNVVGVVDDLRHRSFSEAPIPMVYFSADQRQRPRMTLHVRTSAPAGTVGPGLQRALQATERSAAFTGVETMTAFVDRIMLPQRIGAAAAVATGIVEMTLSVMALYGVIAFAASQRRREIGIRIALGASNGSVLALMMREGLLLTVAGLALGAGLALASGPALGSLLIGISPADPVSFGGGIVAVLAAGALASYLPARRVLQVDPGAALRTE